MATVILILGVVYFVAHLFTALFEKTKVPDVLLLMALGMIAGPIFGWVTPGDFGKVGSVMTTFALIVILFESGTSLNLSALRESAGDTLKLTFGTFAATFIITTALGILLLHLSWNTSFILAAIVSGTSSAVVIPMVRGLHLREPIAGILTVESALTDVLCIVFALAFLDADKAGGIQTGKLVGQILSSFVFAAVIGLVGGIGWLLILNLIRRFPNTIFTTLAFVMILYGCAEFLGFSGGITALSFGIILSNSKLRKAILPFIGKIDVLKNRPLSELSVTEKLFYQEVVFIFKTFFFLFLGISIPLRNGELFLIGFLLVFVIYLGRLGVSRLVLSRSLPWRDATMASVMVPKGLAAAVLAGMVFQRGVSGGETVQTITFMAILISIALTALMVPLIEKTSVSHLYRFIFSSFSGAKHSQTIATRKHKGKSK